MKLAILVRLLGAATGSAVRPHSSAFADGDLRFGWLGWRLQDRSLVLLPLRVATPHAQSSVRVRLSGGSGIAEIIAARDRG